MARDRSIVLGLNVDARLSRPVYATVGWKEEPIALPVATIDDFDDDNIIKMRANSASSNMTSPTWSQASSPSITITFDDGNGNSITMDEPRSLEDMEIVKLSEPSSDFTPVPTNGRPRSLTFDLPPSGERSPCPHIRPEPTRSKDVVGAISTTDGFDDSVSGSLPASSSLRPELQSTGSSFLGGFLQRSLSSSSLNTMFGLGSKKDKAASPKRQKSDPSPEQSDTPEVQDLFKKTDCPDLAAVNRALEALRLKSTAEDNPCFVRLATLAIKLDQAKTDCKKLLNEAMCKRDEGKRESCRGLCVQIIHNAHGDVESRVYAYNILSTLASPGQAMNFLKDAEKLIKQHGEEDRQQLLGTVYMLMEGAKVNDAKTGKKEKKAVETEDGGGLKLEIAPTIPRGSACVAATPTSLLGLPEENGEGGGASRRSDSGEVTPRTQKILTWQWN